MFPVKTQKIPANLESGYSTENNSRKLH